MIRVRNELFCTVETLVLKMHACRGPNGLSASSNGRFGDELFYRDSLQVMQDTMHLPDFARWNAEMFCLLGQWQGFDRDDATNEFPNAMAHQVFRQFANGVSVSQERVERARRSAEKWGVKMQHSPEHGEYFVLYNSSDATPRYVIALAEFCRLYGKKEIFSRSFQHYPSGSARTVAQAAWRCVQFLMDGILAGEAVGHGLYVVPNTNPLQTSPSGVMRDGFDAYYHADGRPIDYSCVAYLENQALVYEALRLAADELFADDLDMAEWRWAAEELRRRTVEKLWITDDMFFAAAYDTSGPVAMRNSSAFELLNGPFFASLTDGQDYVQSLVEQLYSDEFMTPVGVRMISRSHQPLEGSYWAYQGVRAVWPNVTNVIASGLQKWDMPLLAHDLGVRRLIGGLNRAGHATELMYVDDVSGRPLFQPEELTEPTTQHRRIAYPAELGQTTQAWTVSAALRQLTMPRPAVVGSGSWQAALDQKVSQTARKFPTADHVPHMHMPVDLRHGEELKRRRAQELGYVA